jgi:hypothetical protein
MPDAQPTSPGVHFPLRRSLLVGALAGAVLLGGGTRIAMRGVALVEGRVPIWTLTGTLQVMMYGALFGLGLALLWVLVGRRLPGNWLVRGLVFGALATAVVSPGLTPRRLTTFLLFTPWFLLYGVAMAGFAATRTAKISDVRIQNSDVR